MIRPISALAVAALIVVPRPAGAQERQFFRATDSAITSVFMAEPDVLVEGAGLKRWTLPMIQDSLAVHAPGVTFISGSVCGFALRSLPFFRQAVVAAFSPRDATRAVSVDSGVTVFVALIEPQDSALVMVRKFTGDPKRSLAPWRRLVELSRTRSTLLQAGMLANVHARAVGLRPKLSLSARADSAELTQIWSTLAAHHSAEDAATARRLLATSPNMYDRLAAVAILSSVEQEDATWQALVGALLDPKELVREYARAVLQAFTTDLTRRVDWRPAARELHALLQGSDLLSLTETLDMLVATGVGPELARPLLHQGGHAVLMYAGAHNLWARGPAHRFLQAVSGKDLGGNPERWHAWMATL